MSNEVIMQLAGIVKDSTKSESERRNALRHFAALRGEPSAIADGIPENELSAVIEAATAWSSIDRASHDLSLQDAIDHIRTARTNRATIAAGTATRLYRR